jgi:hypothetical protein
MPSLNNEEVVNLKASLQITEDRVLEIKALYEQYKQAYKQAKERLDVLEAERQDSQRTSTGTVSFVDFYYTGELSRSRTIATNNRKRKRR